MAAEGSESTNNEDPSATVRHTLVLEDVNLKNMCDGLEEAQGKLGGVA